MLSLLTQAAQEGSINFIHSDPASNCNPLRTRSSFFPEGKNSFTPDQLVASTWPTLCTDEAARSLREKFCTFRVSLPRRSKVQQESETIVGEVKRYLSKNENHFPQNINVFEFIYILEKTAQFLNSRPLFANGHVVISANDIMCAVG